MSPSYWVASRPHYAGLRITIIGKISYYRESLPVARPIIDLRHGREADQGIGAPPKSGIPFNEIKNIRQTVYLADKEDAKDDDIVLFSHEECLKDKLKQAKNFRYIEEESNKYNASRILQKVGNR